MLGLLHLRYVGEADHNFGYLTASAGHRIRVAENPHLFSVTIPPKTQHQIANNLARLDCPTNRVVVDWHQRAVLTNETPTRIRVDGAKYRLMGDAQQLRRLGVGVENLRVGLVYDDPGLDSLQKQAVVRWRFTQRSARSSSRGHIAKNDHSLMFSSRHGDRVAPEARGARTMAEEFGRMNLADADGRQEGLNRHGIILFSDQVGQRGARQCFAAQSGQLDEQSIGLAQMPVD